MVGGAVFNQYSDVLYSRSYSNKANSLLQNCGLIFIFSLESDVYYAFQYLLYANVIDTWIE